MRRRLAHLLGLGDLVDDLEAAEESRDDALVNLRRLELEHHAAKVRAEDRAVKLLEEVHTLAAELEVAEARITELLLDRAS